MPESPHPSSSEAQSKAEATILDALGKALGVPLSQGAEVPVGDSRVCPDGVDANATIFVEVLAHIGRLRGGQKHKVATDALKLLAIRDAHPTARLILAFADRGAAESIRGWRAATLAANGIELRAVDLDPAERATIEAVQHRQRMVNPD